MKYWVQTFCALREISMEDDMYFLQHTVLSKKYRNVWMNVKECHRGPNPIYTPSSTGKMKVFKVSNNNLISR